MTTVRIQNQRRKYLVLALVLSCGGGAVLLPVRAAMAQDAEASIQNNKKELAKIRAEREELENKMKKLQTNAHSISDELDNINHQQDATQRAVKSLDKQIGVINGAVKETSADLVQTEQEAANKREILRERLIDIYKRGPMYDVEALLSAETFGELVARYKYLHEIALNDRALVRQMEALQVKISARRAQLVNLQGDLNDNKSQKQQEEARLQNLEQKKQKNLQQVQADAKKAQARLKALAAAEAKVNNVIARLETERRRASAKGSAVARGPSSIRTSDYGKLDWPVEGTILYNFGRVQNPNNTTIRWNGIGIEAAAGTPVHAVAAGVVRVAEPMGGYGKTVIIEHGGGDYSIYGSLGSISVREGSKVSKGQVIGTVGVSDPDQPPHLHFEIRHGGPAVDPATWLRQEQ